MSDKSNAGYTDAMMGVDPRSEDPEYLAGYRKAKGSLAAGGWRSIGGGVHVAPNIGDTSFGQDIRQDDK